MPKQELQLEAIKYKYAEDEDGEGWLTFRVSMKHKLSAFAIPVKKRLKILVKIIK